MDQFAHLHVHGPHSLLDGLGPLDQYAERAARLGQPALALTDHGSLSGAMKHWQLCNSVGVKPIIGCEFYVAPQDRKAHSKSSWKPGDAGRVAEDGDNPDLSGSGAYTHLTVLAKSAVGLRNLYRLQAIGYAEGFYRKSRIDAETLALHSEGLVVLSGCAGSAISTRLRLGQGREADELMEFYRQTFRDDFFVEVMYHGILFENALNRDLIELATRHNVPLVATNDAHYCDPESAPVHAALLCVQSQSTLAKPAFSFSGSGYYLRSRQEMESLPLPVEALNNTLWVAERVEKYDSVFEKRIRYPQFELPDGWTAEEALRALVSAGLMERVHSLTNAHYDQAHYEIDVICAVSDPNYFLVLQDVIKEAKSVGVRVGPGRGSAGGSLVAYALGITDLDPIPHGLVFERFMNPARVGLPDIDIDVDESRRDEFLAIVRRKYGEDYVAQICTFGTVGAKAALKDANRVLGGTFKKGEEYTARMPPPKFGRAPSLKDYTGPKDDVYELATGLEGAVRNEGVHAAGVVISPEKIWEVLPVRKVKGEGPWITGFDMKEVEGIGLVKYDFLGLRNLGIIDDTLQMLSKREDESRPGRWTLASLPVVPAECSDPATYELLSSGFTLGVFQLDSPGMRGLLRQLKPSRFDDISAVLALYRPGPMGANAHTEYARRASSGADWKSEWAIHPELEGTLRAVLENTFGLIVFQEQILGTARNPGVLNVICGWTYTEGATLFDAMRKKNHEKMESAKPEYFRAGQAKGFSKEALSALWETLIPFADYSFNRAHTAGYGLVAYWTAYLKANHPTEYMSALLSSVAEDPDRLLEYLEEVNRMGIALLPPDVNVSDVGFTPSSKGIHYGISAIKGVGKAVFEAVSSKRPYASLHDFLMRAPAKALNSGSLAALIGSGTLDSLTDLREELYVARETLAARALVVRREASAGQRPLYRMSFGVGASNIRSLEQRQEWERQYLSTVLSHGEVVLKPKRALIESELVWLRELLTRNPGQTRLQLAIGSVRLQLPSSNWPAVAEAIGSLGAFE